MDVTLDPDEDVLLPADVVALVLLPPLPPDGADVVKHFNNMILSTNKSLKLANNPLYFEECFSLLPDL
ncbi:hypothetical protein DMENIID0001_097170 [Sergentomyia squamirostris]